MEGYKLHTISSEWSHPAGGRQALWAGQNSTSESYFCHGSLRHNQILGTDHIFSLYLVIHQNNSGGESRSHVLTWNISQSSLKLIRIFSFSLHICLTLHAPKCKAMLNIKIVRALPSTCCPSIVRKCSTASCLKEMLDMKFDKCLLKLAVIRWKRTEGVSEVFIISTV